MVRPANKHNLTSPGILLILAVLSTGAIFLLDQFAMKPYIAAQESAVLRQQAARTEQAARQALNGYVLALRQACHAWAQSQQLRELIQKGRSDAQFAALARGSFDKTAMHLAWVSGPDGTALGVWSADNHSDEARSAVAEAVKRLGRPDKLEDAGLLRIGSKVAIFAKRAAVDSGVSQPNHRYLWLARYIDAGILEGVGQSVGGNVVLVAAGELPAGTARGELANSQALWWGDDNTLAVGWRLQDATGSRFGYFRADIPVTQFRRQSLVARRSIQIILALAVGLCALVIVGTHILISGPVIRLLRRLQRLDTGSGRINELTRDLHGEPLVLARRLESAFEQLASLSKTETLTGMANRRHFQNVLEAFYHQARRYNRPLSLIMLDVDFFKAVNDAGGHKAGDNLLKQVAGAIEKVCRKADLPARLGGDEFAILLPETSAFGAADVADRIREEVTKLIVPVRGTQMNVTASVGIADLNSGEIDSPDAMMLLADKAMYTAKKLGRNRIFQAHDLEEQPEAKQAEQIEGMDLLRKKVIGLDTHFKEVFVEGLEEIMEILAQRDPHMAAHAQKVRHYATLIGQEMGLPDRVLKRLRIAAMLHDIGMLAMPDSVLLCDGALGEEQKRCLRRHTLLGVRILESMEFLEQEIPTVRYHHERYDGTGYPEGLAGSAIPLTARIVAVADALDAMTSPRTFRGAKTVADALVELRKGAGSQFDPAVIDAMAALAERLADKLLYTPQIAGRTLQPAQPAEAQPTAAK